MIPNTGPQYGVLLFMAGSSKATNCCATTLTNYTVTTLSNTITRSTSRTSTILQTIFNSLIRLLRYQRAYLIP